MSPTWLEAMTDEEKTSNLLAVADAIHALKQLPVGEPRLHALAYLCKVACEKPRWFFHDEDMGVEL